MIAEPQTLAGRNITLGTIEGIAREFDREVRELDDLISGLETDLEEVKRKHLSRIRQKASRVAQIQADGVRSVEAAPELFTKPRTLTVHGTKFGFSVSEGRVTFDDPDTVCAMIKRLRKDEVDVLIRTSEEPDKVALRNLDSPALAKLGCRIEGAGDTAMFKRVDGDVEKLFKKMMDKLVEAIVEGA